MYPGGRAPRGADRGKTERLRSLPRPVSSLPSPAPPVPRAEFADITWGRLGAVGSSPRSLPFFFFCRLVAGSGGPRGLAGGRLFGDSGRTCPLGGHCGSCRRLRAAFQGALLGRPAGGGLGGRRNELLGQDPCTLGTLGPRGGAQAFLWVLVGSPTRGSGFSVGPGWVPDEGLRFFCGSWLGPRRGPQAFLWVPVASEALHRIYWCFGGRKKTTCSPGLGRGGMVGRQARRDWPGTPPFAGGN